MALYMKYDGIDGKVQTAGYENWIEIQSFNWGTTRALATPVGSAQDREATVPSVSEITVAKQMDVSTYKLVEEALDGELNNKVEIAVCTTGQGKLIEFLRYTLTNTGVSSYSVVSGGDRPMETFTLNFAKVEFKYTSLNSDLQGNPASTIYDLAKNQLNP